MNGKMAKALRRAVLEQMDSELEQVPLGSRRKTMKTNRDFVKYNQSVKQLHPDLRTTNKPLLVIECFRARYKQAKKIAKEFTR